MNLIEFVFQETGEKVIGYKLAHETYNNFYYLVKTEQHVYLLQLTARGEKEFYLQGGIER